jgi:hypothetical protein
VTYLDGKMVSLYWVTCPGKKNMENGLIVMGDLPRKNIGLIVMGDPPRWKNGFIVMDDLPRLKNMENDLIVMGDLPRKMLVSL